MSKTILLADDSVTIQKVVELTFMEQDVQVVAVSDGAQAVAKLTEMTPDLVIADVHMPEKNGYEVCRHCKQSYPGLPVLLLVGTFEPFDEQEAAACGSDGHLKKPFDSQDLLRQVDTLLNRAAPQASVSATPEAAAQPGPAETIFEEPTMAMPPAVPAPDAFAPEAPAPELAIPAPEPLVAVPEPAPAVPEPIAPAIPEPAAPVIPEAPPVAPAAAVPSPVAPAVPEPASPNPVAAEPPPAPAAGPSAAGPLAGGNGALSEEDVDRIAQRVVELSADKLLREIAWEVIPDLAEVVIKERIRELEGQLESAE